MTGVGAARDRRHEEVPHTADVAFRAIAPSLPGLFEEAAMALAEIAADRGAGTGPSHEVSLSTKPGQLHCDIRDIE